MNQHRYFNWRHNRVSTQSKEPLAENNNDRLSEMEENGESLEHEPTTNGLKRACIAGTVIGALVLGIALAVVVTLWLTSSTSSVTCNPSCVNGICTASDVCTCNSGWSGSSCSQPICINPCQNNGTCSSPNTCTCTSQWSGATCSVPICTSTCQNSGTCTAPNTCTCTSQWSGPTCSTPICSPTCQNSGTCTAPNTCACTSQWTDAICSTPICSPTCQNNGTCTAPNTCACTSQWTGAICSVPVCSPTCQNNGTCTAPNTCACTSQWTNAICSTPVCSSACQNNGTCTAPNTCTCTSQWIGATCTVPVCSPTCQNNGTCIAPNVCNCTSSWMGTVCQTPICSPSCLNDGNCTAPNTCTCDTATWVGSICQTPIRILWSFDWTLNNLYNNYNGVGNNAPGYVSPGYNGAGSCLWLDRSLSQSVTVSFQPYVSLINMSFTFEVWIYPQTVCDGITCIDNGIIGQNDNRTKDQLLHLVVRSERAYLGFFADDAGGIQILNAQQWYHLAFIYDVSTYTQYIYINGYLDLSRSAAGPYQGTPGPFTIGNSFQNANNNYFDGCLDSLAYFARAKSGWEILDDATWVAYLSFDGSTLLDSGPLLINGTGTGYSYTASGRVNEAITLSTSSSYVQITGLRRLGTHGWPYSVAIWINPTSLSGGTIMHLSSRTDGAQTSAWCLPIMGLTSLGAIAINSWNNSNVPLTGPVIPLNAWTHVAATYSSANGERLYVDGTLISSTGGYSFRAGGAPMTITLGSSLLGTGVCNTGTIQMGQFYGSLDEFYVYARELTASDVFTLASV